MGAKHSLEDHNYISVKPSEHYRNAYDISIGRKDVRGGSGQILTVTETDMETLRAEINHIFRYVDNDD